MSWAVGVGVSGGSGVGALLDNSAGFLPNHVGEFVKQEIAV